MSKHSLNIAVKYGESLREFRDQSEAENYYISYKDDLLNRLKAISTQASAFFPDYTIESLKKLEIGILIYMRNNHLIRQDQHKKTLKA